jgi:hypothetical protein
MISSTLLLMSVGSLFFLVTNILIIVFFFRCLKSEKEGFMKIADAAQELNNKTLHDASKKLFYSNKLKYWIIYLSLAQLGLYLFVVLSIIASH